MDSFVIQIAGLVTLVEPLYESTCAYCGKYRTDLEPVYFVRVTEADLNFEQKMLDIEAREEGLRPRKFTGPFLERSAIQRKIAEELLRLNTILLHGSTVGLDGAAYLFTAACGTGKSTHTRLWRDVFGERAVMINDDKPFLKIQDGRVTAYGSPWSGKHGLDSNINLPLQGICILKRGPENQIRKITAAEAREMLLHQSFFHIEPRLQERNLLLVETLMKSVPLWEMVCNKSTEAAVVAYGAMSQEK
jgi:hypothetical protein